MILCEECQPSIDALHHLLNNISVLNEQVLSNTYLDRLYEEGEKIITKRLLKYF